MRDALRIQGGYSPQRSGLLQSFRWRRVARLGDGVAGEGARSMGEDQVGRKYKAPTKIMAGDVGFKLFLPS